MEARVYSTVSFSIDPLVKMHCKLHCRLIARFRFPSLLNFHVPILANWNERLSQQIFQRCFNGVCRLIWRREVRQRQINVVYFNVALKNVRQRWNNVVIFNVDLHNVEPRWINVVNMTIKKWKINFESSSWIILLSFNKSNLNWIR